MNTVQFTKNVNAKTRKNGEYLLGIYFRESKLSKAPYYPVTNFKGMIVNFDSRYPTYIEFLGDLMRTVELSKLIQAMKDAAAKGLTSYPSPATFSQSISENAKYTFSETLGTAASEIGNDILDYANIFSKSILFFAILGAGVFVYLNTGGKLPKINLGKIL